MFPGDLLSVFFLKLLMRHSYKEERNVNVNNTHTSFYLKENITN